MKQPFLILLLAILFTSCAEKLTPDVLTNSNWKLTEWPGHVLPEKAIATLSFRTENNISGKSFCNGFGGKYIAEGNNLKFSNVFGTKMYCEEVGTAETAFLNALNLTNSAKIKENKLYLMQNNNILLIFSKQE